MGVKSVELSLAIPQELRVRRLQKELTLISSFKTFLNGNNRKISVIVDT